MGGRIKKSKVYSDTEFDYMCVTIRDQKANHNAMRELHELKTISRSNLYELGLDNWKFYCRMKDSWEIMVQRIRKK
jgi:hypothetical protein